MMIGEPVFHRRYQSSKTDRYSQSVEEYVEVAEPLMCLVAPRTGNLTSTPGRDRVEYDYTVYAPAGTSIGLSDQLKVRGQWCTLTSPPGHWRKGSCDAGVVIEVKFTQG